MGMNILVGSSVVGAIFFTMMNRCLTGGSSNSVSHDAKKSAGGSEDGHYDKVSKDETHSEGDAEGSNVAFSIWLGILIDGVPESMLIGFMQSEGELSVAFIVAVFLANFPEAMSASAIMSASPPLTANTLHTHTRDARTHVIVLQRCLRC